MDESVDFLGRGWSFPPELDPITGRFVLCSEDEDIRQAILIILTTRRQERQMLPSFGSNVHDYVFDVPDASAMALLQDEVMTSITMWEPRVINVEVSISLAGIVDGAVLINVSYNVRATNNPGNLVFPFYLYEGVGIE